jgi:hypothetical protein
MLTKKTLFVIGAGASKEVGLPTGQELAKTISRMLDVHTGGVHNDKGEALLSQLYDKRPLPSGDYHRAAVAISDGVRLTRSIDDYLDRHASNELIQVVGKTAIVKSILEAEAESVLALHPRSSATLDKLDGTWFMRFFRVLGTDRKVEKVRDVFVNVSFIVFNYDRCLEYFLFNALQQVYGISANEAASIVEDIHIIHPYGIVAPPPLRDGRVPFGYTGDLDYVGFSSGVRIYTEQLAAGEPIDSVHGEMIAAKQIVFLGFGFHETNLALLSPPSLLSSMPVFGTATNMSDNNREVIHNRLARMFKPAPPRIKPYSPIVLDNKVTCAGLLDDYAESIVGR